VTSNVNNLLVTLEVEVDVLVHTKKVPKLYETVKFITWA